MSKKRMAKGATDAPRISANKLTATAVGLVLLGLVFRLYQLSAENITCDEGYSIRLAGLGIEQILRTLFRSDFNPPLHFLFLHYWIGFFGNSEFSARLPSAIFGALSIFAIYRLGSVAFGGRVGVIAALLLSLSWFLVYYSQEARAYSLMVLLTILSFHYFISLLKERSPRNSALYVASSALLLYTHLFGVFMIAAQNAYVAYLALSRRGDSRRALKRWALREWMLHQLALLALFSPWLYALANQVFRAKGLVDASAWVIEKPTSASLFEPFASFAGSAWLLLLYASVLIGSIAVAHLKGRQPFKGRSSPLNSLKERSSKGSENLGAQTEYIAKMSAAERGKIALLLIWILAPTATALLLSYASVPIYIDKYLIGTAPALYLLVARAIDRICAVYRPVAAAAIAAAVALSLYGLWDNYETTNKKQSKEVASIIDANASPGDLVLINPRNYVENVFDYYSNRADLVEVGFPSKGFYADRKNLKELSPIVEKYDRIWLVEFLDDERNLKLIKGALARTHELAGDGRYAGVDLLYYEKRGR